ncbi:MAG: hypothetical protein AVDCRST_MAG12-258, partial [uncultured Rubrobacteraceae bacterium]
ARGPQVAHLDAAGRGAHRVALHRADLCLRG